MDAPVRGVFGNLSVDVGSRFSLGVMTTDDHNLFVSLGDGLRNNAAWERYAGDEYSENPQSRRFARVADNPDEIRLRTTLEWTRRPARAGAGVGTVVRTGVRTTLRLGYEQVTRFDFTDRNRSNLLAQVAVGYAW